MAIRVTLSSGITSAKTTSLFQWDYGQQLEIVSDDLPSVVEVHFACKGMSEAVVMPCSITDGTGIVTIPDSCLEQSTDITAWVYSIEGTQGKTVKTITIPIVARIRPGRSETIPQGFSDQYTELISQINDAIGDLKDGSVTVKKAEIAETATRATSATNASFANTANGVSINGKVPFSAPISGVKELPGEGYYCIITHSPYGGYLAPVITYWDGKSVGLLGMVQPVYHDGESHEPRTLCLCVGDKGRLVLDRFEGVYSGSSNLLELGYTLDVTKLWG